MVFILACATPLCLFNSAKCVRSLMLSSTKVAAIMKDTQSARRVNNSKELLLQYEPLQEMAWWSERQWRLSTCIHNIGWVIAGRGKNPIVIWNWVWFGPMWMNSALGVMQMKWQIQEEEWHGLVCQNQMCPRFLERLCLISLMDPWGAGAAGWLWGVLGFSRTWGDEWKLLGWQGELLKVRECRKGSAAATPQTTTTN